MVELMDEVMRLHGRYLSVTWPAALKEGLTGPSQIMVLDAVVRSPQPPTVPKIGRSLGHSRQAIQRTVDNLVALGLVEWRENDRHKTARLVVATPAGLDTMKRIGVRMGGWADEVGGATSAADLEKLVALLRQVRTQFEDSVRKQQTRAASSGGKR
jgi:DNA-binding MarR family transcriptional regulator